MLASILIICLIFILIPFPTHQTPQNRMDGNLRNYSLMHPGPMDTWLATKNDVKQSGKYNVTGIV